MGIQGRQFFSALTPNANSEDERRTVHDLSCLTRIGRRVAILARISEPHIGRELPADLIADAYPGVEVGQPPIPSRA